MAVSLTSNFDVYCYLKASLEPDYQVVAQPSVSYFAQWQFCYRILRDAVVIEELVGDFRELPDNALVLRAQAIVTRLGSSNSSSCMATDGDVQLPFASRLPPKRDNRTWFSSGRAAFAWLVGDVVRPKRLFLPTFVCWSLIEVMQSAFPGIKLRFYTVDRRLQFALPHDLNDEDALVFIHYFGKSSDRPEVAAGCTLLEDESHLTLSNGRMYATQSGDFQFGSLRKTYRVADGGYVRGAFTPDYDGSQRLDGWLRMRSRDWRDLREAENMTDRSWNVSDISSQSLAVVLQTDEATTAAKRIANNRFLDENLYAGSPLLNFRDRECPLLHTRIFSSKEERDSFKAFMADQGMFTSIHWPVHPYVLEQSAHVDVYDAIWLEQHSLAIPVSDDFQIEHMERFCEAARKWAGSGGTCFASRAAG